MCVCTCVCVHVCVYMCVFTCVCVYMCVYVCVCVSVCVHLCAHLCLLSTCECMFTAHASPLQVINTYTEAVQTVDAKQAVGKPHTLWVEFAKFYESNNQIPEVGPTCPHST